MENTQKMRTHRDNAVNQPWLLQTWTRVLGEQIRNVYHQDVGEEVQLVSLRMDTVPDVQPVWDLEN